MNKEALRSSARNIAALRQLDLIDAAAVVSWASERVVEEGTSELLLALASVSPNTEATTVDGLLTELLNTLESEPIDAVQAGCLAARMMAEQIVDGSVDPAMGARHIWWDIVRKVPSLEDRLGHFAALASEWEDSPNFQAEYERDIVLAATRFLESYSENVPDAGGEQL